MRFASPEHVQHAAPGEGVGGVNFGGSVGQEANPFAEELLTNLCC